MDLLFFNRELKNKITGIDLYVSDFQEIPHRLRKSTYLYHVIVITNLFYYKTKKHKEGDVVQFMVNDTIWSLFEHEIELISCQCFLLNPPRHENIRKHFFFQKYVIDEIYRGSISRYRLTVNFSDLLAI